MGVWRTDRALIEQIIARRGYLLNIASLAAASHTPLMGPYSASKAGVEALTDSLRAEMAPTARASAARTSASSTPTSCARASPTPRRRSSPETLPKFVSTPAPLSTRSTRSSSGVRRRSARLWAPRYVGGALVLRGVLQPLTELQMRFNRDLPRAMELADPARGGARGPALRARRRPATRRARRPRPRRRRSPLSASDGSRLRVRR